MAGETIITIVGNLTADPELRYTNSGVPVASFNVASTPRVFDKQAGEWRDGDTLFIRCNAWRKLGENITESLNKGVRVIVQGRLEQKNYTDRDGNKRTSIQLIVDEVGPSLAWATAKPVRNPPQGGHGWGTQQPQGGYRPTQNTDSGDPWASTAPEDPPPF